MKVNKTRRLKSRRVKTTYKQFGGESWIKYIRGIVNSFLEFFRSIGRKISNKEKAEIIKGVMVRTSPTNKNNEEIVFEEIIGALYKPIINNSFIAHDNAVKNTNDENAEIEFQKTWNNIYNNAGNDDIYFYIKNHVEHLGKIAKVRRDNKDITFTKTNGEVIRYHNVKSGRILNKNEVEYERGAYVVKPGVVYETSHSPYNLEFTNRKCKKRASYKKTRKKEQSITSGVFDSLNTNPNTKSQTRIYSETREPSPRSTAEHEKNLKIYEDLVDEYDKIYEVSMD
uniref:Uncharacterized protein n=1 Tax=viral metagenome TaxID=1070528 RepID=A0A6C0HSA6_9ZZZZ